MLRIAFLGTGRLAQPVFAALCDSPHAVVGLVTQPDRTGRGHHQHVNPLKTLAESRGIPVLQPEKIKTPESVDALRQWQADLFVVAAYGQLLPKSILEMPRLGCINVHASLLPKYRGATPIHAAILNGDAETGVTIIRLVSKLDAGPILGAARTTIGEYETTGELEGCLSELAVPITLQVIQELDAGTCREMIQDEAQATHVGKLDKEDGWIPWEKTAFQVVCHIRGMQPWPGAFSQIRRGDHAPLRVKILEAMPKEDHAMDVPGSVSAVTRNSLVVRCGQGGVSVVRLQPDGKRPMNIDEFLRGHPVQAGDRFVSVTEKS